MADRYIHELPELAATPAQDDELIVSVTSEPNPNARTRRLKVRHLPSGDTPTPVEATVEHDGTLTGSGQPSSPLSVAFPFSQALLDTINGKADMTKVNAAFQDEMRLRGLGDDLQSVTVATFESYASALDSQLTSDQPLEIVIAADIAGERNGTRYAFSDGDVLSFAPLSDRDEFRFNIRQGNISGDVPDARITGNTVIKGLFTQAIYNKLSLTDGSISIAPDVVPNAAAIVRDFTFSHEDLNASALSAAGVNEVEMWMNNTAFHAIDPWVPAEDGTYEVNVNDTEARAIAVGNAKQIPVRMVFRRDGQFVALMNTWLQIGDPNLNNEIQERRLGDTFSPNDIADATALATLLAGHGKPGGNALLIHITADFTTSARSYVTGQRWYIPPHLKDEAFLALVSEAGGGLTLTNEQKAELIGLRIQPSVVIPSDTAFKTWIVRADDTTILGTNVWATTNVNGQSLPRQRLTSGALTFTYSDAIAEGINNNITADERVLNVAVHLFDAQADGNLLAILNRDVTIQRPDATKADLAGAKFTGPVEVPTPKTDAQAANKKYVDDSVEPVVQTVTPAAIAVEIDRDSGEVADLNLNRNITLTIIGGVNGNSLIVYAIQDATGSRTISYGGSAIEGLSTDAASVDAIAFVRRGGAWVQFGSVIGGAV